LTGFSYAPRFKNLKRQRLYIFRSRQSVDRSAWKIKPAAYCDEQHIIQFWDDILRFIATIKLKETTASDIFRRLNSYSKQHGLYHALKAFGQILKSIFILRVIDAGRSDERSSSFSTSFSGILISHRHTNQTQ
jgi:TnpA family transposase